MKEKEEGLGGYSQVSRDLPSTPRRKAKASILWAIALAAAVGAGVYCWQRQVLQRERAEAGAQHAAMQGRILSLEQEIEGLQTERDHLGRFATTHASGGMLEESYGRHGKPRPGWEKYFPRTDTTTLRGRTAAEVKKVLGDPFACLRYTSGEGAGRKEIWVYAPYDDDLTGVYVYFDAGEVVRGKVDEFNGFGVSIDPWFGDAHEPY